MNFRLLSGPTIALCSLMASCYPLPEPRIQQGTTPPTQQVAPEQQQALTQSQREEELRLKAAEEDLRHQQAQLDTQPPTTPQPPQRPATTDYPFANRVPGKEGLVFSPYNNEVIDVREIPSGTLVQDPNYPASEKKYFRVP